MLLNDGMQCATNWGDENRMQLTELHSLQFMEKRYYSLFISYAEIISSCKGVVYHNTHTNIDIMINEQMDQVLGLIGPNKSIIFL